MHYMYASKVSTFPKGKKIPVWIEIGQVGESDKSLLLLTTSYYIWEMRLIDLIGCAGLGRSGKHGSLGVQSMIILPSWHETR